MGNRRPRSKKKAVAPIIPYEGGSATKPGRESKTGPNPATTTETDLEVTRNGEAQPMPVAASIPSAGSLPAINRRKLPIVSIAIYLLYSFGFALIPLLIRFIIDLFGDIKAEKMVSPGVLAIKNFGAVISSPDAFLIIFLLFAALINDPISKIKESKSKNLMGEEQSNRRSQFIALSLVFSFFSLIVYVLMVSNPAIFSDSSAISRIVFIGSSAMFIAYLAIAVVTLTIKEYDNGPS